MTGKQRQTIRRLILERDGPLCCWCKKPLLFGKRMDFGIREPDDWATIEHLIPISRGGTNDLSNLALAHKLCNSSRHHV